MRARSCCCAASGCSPAWSRRRSTAACRPTRRPSATPASSATIADGKPFLSREVLGGGSGGRYYADGNDAIHIVPDFAQPAGRVHRDALSAAGREARAAHGFRRRRQAPRRARLREALSRAGRLPHHRHRRPRAARLLRRQRRQGRPAVLRHRRRRRRAARPRRPGRRRAGAAGTGRARGDDRRRRLGRSARARAGAGAARRDRGQGVARGGAGGLRRGAGEAKRRLCGRRRQDREAAQADEGAAHGARCR